MRGEKEPLGKAPSASPRTGANDSATGLNTQKPQEPEKRQCPEQKVMLQSDVQETDAEGRVKNMKDE
jgi:hypothetical protein